MTIYFSTFLPRLAGSIGSLAALGLLSACGGGGGDDSAPAVPQVSTQTVTLQFAAVAGNTPVACGTAISGLGRDGVAAQLKDLRFYVANIVLLKADGSEQPFVPTANSDWHLHSGSDSVTLIDLEDGSGNCSEGTAATHGSLSATVPAGSYTGVKFTLGVPFAMNHSDYATAARPLDVQAMAWSWQVGRKFAKIELGDPGGTTGTWTAKTFNMHLGATGCTGNPANGETVSCKAPNRAAVVLSGFNPETQKIALDLRALLASIDITANQAGAAGCMSGGTDPECQAIFSALAIDWKPDGSGTGLPLNGGATQTVFKAVAK